jgi:hypothetical protein
MAATTQQLLARVVDLFGPLPSAVPTAIYGNLMVSPAGKVLVGTMTDNGSDALQVNGTVSITGVIKSATPALYDNSTNSATTAFVLANAWPMRAPLTGASTDLNTYTSSGIYHQSANANAASGSHYPAPYAGMLEVYASSSMVYQRYTLYSSGIVYVRSYYNGTWYAWRQLLDTVGASTIAGAMTFTAAASFSGGIWNQGGFVELGSLTATMTPFLDFHSSGTGNDYDARIICSGGTATIGGGALNVYAGTSIYNCALQVKTGPALPLTLVNSSTSGSWSVGPDASDSFCVYNNNGTGVFVGYGGTGWAANSDERLKNIKCDLLNALEAVKSIRTVKYTWKRDDDQAEALGLPNDSMVYVGVIAQDVQAVLPEAVTTSASGYLAVRYGELAPLALAAIKELSAKLDSALARIAQIEGA